MWYPVWSSAAVVVYVFKYALLSGYLSYLFLTLSPKESEHSMYIILMAD